MRSDRALKKANETYWNQTGVRELSATTAALMALIALPYLIVTAAMTVARRMVGQ